MRLSVRIPVLALTLLAAASAVGCDQVSARRKIQEGNKAYGASKYDEAIADYEQALALRPELTIGWYNLGLAHLALFTPGNNKDATNQKHAQGAIDAFQKVLERDPGDKKSRDYMLQTYIDSGHYEGAITYFTKKYEGNTKDLEAIGELAVINKQAGKFDDANKWNRTLADVSPSVDGKATAFYTIGTTNWGRLNNHPAVVGEDRLKIADEGIAALQQADKLRPNHAATISYSNLLYRERANAHDASFARAVDQTNAQIYFKRAVEMQKQQAAAQPKPATPAPK